MSSPPPAHASTEPAVNSHRVYTRRRVIAASIASAVPIGVYAALRRGTGGSGAAGRVGPELPAEPVPLAAEPTTTPRLTQVPSTASAPPVVAEPELVMFDHAIGPGSAGAKVRALQDRLRELKFDPGPSDGVFGPATERAVWAYEKFIEGVPFGDVMADVTPERWVRMNNSFEVRPRRANRGTHVEVLLPSQIAVVYRDSDPVLITHVSSGTGEEWCSVVKVDEEDGTTSEQAICGVAVTPGGLFRFERRVSGWRNAKLGRLYNPVYFNYGIAVHGATSVPKVPASRGCVRIPMHIAEYFPSLVADGDLVYVFDGIEQPETYGAQLPVFDYPDPSATTTTSPSPPSTDSGTSTTPTTTSHGHPT